MGFLLDNLETIGALTGFLSDGLSGAASSAQAEVDAANARARSEAAKLNAEIAEQQAAAERTAAVADAEDFRRQQSARRASSRAAAAGGGFTMEGSPLLVDEAVMAEIELSASRIRGQGDIRATRMEQEAFSLKRQSKQERQNARSASQAGTFGIFTNAASSFASGVNALKPTLVNGEVSYG